MLLPLGLAAAETGGSIWPSQQSHVRAVLSYLGSVSSNSSEQEWAQALLGRAIAQLRDQQRVLVAMQVSYSTYPAPYITQIHMDRQIWTSSPTWEVLAKHVWKIFTYWVDSEQSKEALLVYRMPLIGSYYV